MALIVLGFVLIVASVIIWYMFPPDGEQSNPGQNQEPTVAVSNIPRVSVVEAKEAFDQNQAVFLDVRGASFYEDSHIPGALSIPLNELEERMDELDPDDWIVTYCT